MDNGLPPGEKNPCHGSPLPKIPWGTTILLTNEDNGIEISPKLIDYGPDAPPEATASIDLTTAAFMNAGGKMVEGRLPNITFRIPGGAKYLKS
jgi:hypothetical protein